MVWGRRKRRRRRRKGQCTKVTPLRLPFPRVDVYQVFVVVFAECPPIFWQRLPLYKRIAQYELSTLSVVVVDKKVWHWHWEIEQKERKERRRETTINSRFHGTLGVPSSTVSCCCLTHLMLHKRISSSDKISAPNTEQRQCSVHDTVAAEAEYHRQQLPHLRAFVKCTNAKQQ